MRNLDKIDHQDQGIEVEIDIVEIAEGVVMIDIVEVLVDHQMEVVMIEEIIHLIEVIQEIDIGIMIDMIEEIDIVWKDQGYLEIIILEDIEVEVIQDLDIKVVGGCLLRNVLSVVEQDTKLMSLGIFKNIGKQLSRLKDGQSSKRKIDEDSSDKAFVMQSVNSLLEDLGLGIDSTNF